MFSIPTSVFRLARHFLYHRMQNPLGFQLFLSFNGFFQAGKFSVGVIETAALFNPVYVAERFQDG